MNAAAEHTIDVYGITQDSIVDGPGLRFAIFVQGCAHNCPGCHNPESHPYGTGRKYGVKKLLDMVEGNPLVRGVTISGGEPFDQAQACGELASMLKAHGYDVWVYTGYLFEELLDRSDNDQVTKVFLDNIDVLIDGPFLETQRSYDLKWRGSSNQRILDISASLACGKAVSFLE